MERRRGNFYGNLRSVSLNRAKNVNWESLNLFFRWYYSYFAGARSLKHGYYGLKQSERWSLGFSRSKGRSFGTLDGIHCSVKFHTRSAVFLAHRIAITAAVGGLCKRSFNLRA